MRRQTTHSRPHQVVRRKTRRRRPLFARFIRVVLMLAVIASILFCAKAVIVKAARPYLISYGESKESSEIKLQMAEAYAESKVLKKEIPHLLSPEGMEAEARKLGWVKKGEVAIVVEQPKQSQIERSGPAGPSERESCWHVIGRHILGLFVRADPAP